MKICKIVLCFFLATVLVACGGGSSGSQTAGASSGVSFSSVPAISVPATSVVGGDTSLLAKPANLNVHNADSNQARTIVPGERNVSAVGFAVVFDQSQNKSTISELVFRNEGGASLLETTSESNISFRYGTDDVNTVKQYSVSIAGDRITIRFEDPWRGEVPYSSKIESFSLVMNILPTARKGHLKLRLIGVQLTTFEAITNINDVVGPLFTIDETVQVPVLFSNSDPRTSTPFGYGSWIVDLGKVSAYCPASNKQPCILDRIGLRTSFLGTESAPYVFLNVEGRSYYSNGTGFYQDILNINLSIVPGESKELTFQTWTFGGVDMSFFIQNVSFKFGESSVLPLIDPKSKSCNNILIPLVPDVVYPLYSCQLGTKG